MEVKFDNVDWNDIVDAEQANDEQTLRNSSTLSQQQKLNKANATERISVCSPTSRALPFQDWDENTPSPTYAQVARPARGNKRQAGDQMCLSPQDRLPNKKCNNLPTPKQISHDYLSPLSENTPGQNDRSEHIADHTSMQKRRLFAASPENRSTTPECLDDAHRLAQRQKQVDFGKNTVGYDIYVQAIPKWQRKNGDPQTPDKYQPCSTRSWQGQIRAWRRALHRWDPAGDSEEKLTMDEIALCDL
ncbi:hypothetical protein EMCRGX_G029415 [Ephydatia muelleri]